jgi:23S rRNA A2030 N6-methylase RlmJ
LNKIPERARQAQIVRAAPNRFQVAFRQHRAAFVGRQVVVAREDGFEALKTFCRRRSTRAMVLCDPSYK